MHRLPSQHSCFYYLRQFWMEAPSNQSLQSRLEVSSSVMHLGRGDREGAMCPLPSQHAQTMGNAHHGGVDALTPPAPVTRTLLTPPILSSKSGQYFSALTLFWWVFVLLLGKKNLRTKTYFQGGGGNVILINLNNYSAVESRMKVFYPEQMRCGIQDPFYYLGQWHVKVSFYLLCTLIKHQIYSGRFWLSFMVLICAHWNSNKKKDHWFTVAICLWAF